MAISVCVDSCQKALRVKEEYAGRTVKCPQCKSGIRVPSDGASGAPPTPPARRTPADRPKPQSVSKSAAIPVQDSLNKPQTAADALPLPPNAIQEPGAPISQKKVSVSAATDPARLMREILSAFEGEFSRVRPTLGYRLAALFVGGFMILLPLIYASRGHQ